MIYFVCHGASNLVKIGYTGVPVDERLKALQAYSPVQLDLLAVADGNQPLEAWLHARFSDLRLHGEWFKLEGPLRDLVHRLVVSGPSYLATYVETGKQTPPAHGTISAYVGLRCRCDACRAANRDYHSRYRRRGGGSKNRRNRIAS